MAAFNNYPYGMHNIAYTHPPANHAQAYPMNGLGLGANGMDMLHPGMNPYTPGK